MNKELLLVEQVPFFENDKHVDPQGIETWSARDLSQRLGYHDWGAFQKIIQLAKTASDLRDIDPNTQFRESTRLIYTHDQYDPIPDVQLTRYACYLIAQHADAKNPRVAEAQIYFSIHTYRQEVLADLTEDERRIDLRGEVTLEIQRLVKTARASGLNQRHYGSFHNEGYLGLYRLTHRALKDRRNIGSATILDQIGPTELAANIMRIMKTQERLRNELESNRAPGDTRTKEIHNLVGARVRKAMVDIGGIVPEDLPIYDPIQETKRKQLASITRPFKSPLKSLGKGRGRGL